MRVTVTGPYVGQRYTTSDSRHFQITRLYEVSNDPWVEYTNTSQSYTCRLEAFLARFSPIAD